tara:strand:+ start:10969 stop:11253 length:285 start_codon:yes stop_codon:yes gene_type:complete
MLLYLPPDIIEIIFSHIANDAMDISRNYINIEHINNIERVYDYTGTMLNGLPHGQGKITSCIRYTTISTPYPRHSKWLLYNLVYILKSYTPIIK